MNDKEVAIKMGKEIQIIRNKLIKFICNPEYQKLLTKKIINHNSRALKNIDKFRSEAEDRMFERQIINNTDVFYGYIKKLEEGESIEQ